MNRAQRRAQRRAAARGWAPLGVAPLDVAALAAGSVPCPHCGHQVDLDLPADLSAPVALDGMAWRCDHGCGAAGVLLAG